MAWTDERIDQLRKLWGDGLTASQIASTIGGVSRNAVIGKIHRLGLSGRVKATSQQVRVRKRKVAAERPAYTRPAPRRTVVATSGNAALKLVALEEEEPVVRPVTEAVVVPLRDPIGLMDLRAEHCRWPLGHPGDEGFRYCGLKSPLGQPYCAGHAAKAYSAPVVRKKKVAGRR